MTTGDFRLLSSDGGSHAIRTLVEPHPQNLSGNPTKKGSRILQELTLLYTILFVQLAFRIPHLAWLSAGYRTRMGK